MPQISVNDRKAHYREWGSGATIIVMLHGWPADSSHYAELGPLLAKKGYTVIVPDFPGFGQTPPPKEAWKVSDYRDWVEAFLQAKGVNSCVLFGHSFGGRVAIKYSIKHAYRVNKLVLCASAGIKPDAHTAKRRSLSVAAKIGKKIFSIPGMRKSEHAAKRILYKLAGSKDYLNAHGVMKETIVKVLEEDLTPFLSQLQEKTLLLWGDQDGATPLSDGQKMNELIPHSELIVYKGERHNLVKNAPQQVADSIDTFIRRSE